MEQLGCLGIWEELTDYVLCEWESDLLPKLYKQDEKIYQYNQLGWKWSTKSCTIFAAIGMAADLWNYDFSESEIKEIDELSYSRWRVRGQWWYVQKAVKLVNDRWNSNEKLVKMYGKMAFYRVSKYDNENMEDIMDKLYTLDWNYSPNSKYNQDRADWMIDWTDFWTNTNGHSVDVRKVDNQRSVKDSYFGREYNIYWLKHKLSEITNYWEYFYVYTKVKEDNLEEIKRLNEIKSLCNNIIELLGKLYHFVNDKNFQGILHYTAEKLRGKINDCNEQLKKY